MDVPAGTSTSAMTLGPEPNNRVRWNRIEHRLFAFITQNWRGKPLLTHQVIVQLIASTTTRTGLTVQCRLDRSAYAKRVQGVRCRDGHPQSSARRVSRRLELHHQATTAHRLTRLFGLRPLEEAVQQIGGVSARFITSAVT